MFLNQSGSIGVIITYFTMHVTGSELLTYFLFMMFFLSLGFAFRMPTEISIPLLLPFIIVMIGYSSDFLTIGGIVIIYSAILFIGMLSWLR